MYRFIILMGIVSFFADVTYEGMRSITGPFMGLLGASGAIVGTVAGLGEFAGYGIRLISGVVTDKTKSYWVITFIGYAINLIVVPLMALASRWEIAAVLIVLERIGKAIRTPARDTLLSYACTNIGRGWGFGIHEAMDRVGALLGPVIVVATLLHAGSYRSAFAWLGIPAAFALIALAYAKKSNPNPEAEETKKLSLSFRGFSRSFWTFIAAASLIGAGYADFALISFHFQKLHILKPNSIPLLYMFAMGSAALFSLIGGKLFDFFTKPIVILGVIIGALSSPFVFFGHFSLVVMGMIFWGIGLGMQGSLLRSIIAHLTSPEQRSTAYGTFGLIFGFFWFCGSAILGVLYDRSILATVAFSTLLQLCSIPLLLKIEIPNQR